METRLHRALRNGMSLALAAGLWIGAGVAHADVLTDWNIIMDIEAGLIRPSAHGASRGCAWVQGAAPKGSTRSPSRGLLKTAMLRAS